MWKIVNNEWIFDPELPISPQVLIDICDDCGTLTMVCRTMKITKLHLGIGDKSSYEAESPRYYCDTCLKTYIEVPL
jgi:hypothetical protein